MPSCFFLLASNSLEVRGGETLAEFGLLDVGYSQVGLASERKLVPQHLQATLVELLPRESDLGVCRLDGPEVLVGTSHVTNEKSRRI